MSTIILLITLLVVALLTRIFYLIMSPWNPPLQKRTKPSKTLIILGSGGHTTEMMAILQQMNLTNYSPRVYVLAKTDTTSHSKIIEFEGRGIDDVEIATIFRSRHVSQSYVSSVLTTLFSIFMCIPLVLRSRPDLILCNGPGTCVPICLIAFLLKVFGINRHVKISFIESYCRVKTLSLTGKILLPFADLFAVQWPDLTKISKRIQYFGRLM